MSATEWLKLLKAFGGNKGCSRAVRGDVISNIYCIALEAHSVVRRVLIIQSPDHRKLEQRIGGPTLVRNFLTFADTAPIAYGQKMGRSLSNSIFYPSYSILIRLSTSQTNTGSAAPQLCIYAMVVVLTNLRKLGTQHTASPTLFSPNTESLLCVVPYRLYSSTVRTAATAM